MAELTARINRHIAEVEMLAAKSLSKRPNDSARHDNGKSAERTSSKREVGGRASIMLTLKLTYLKDM